MPAHGTRQAPSTTSGASSPGAIETTNAPSRSHPPSTAGSAAFVATITTSAPRTASRALAAGFTDRPRTPVISEANAAHRAASRPNARISPASHTDATTASWPRA
jgi:hypothetical protein